MKLTEFIDQEVASTLGHLGQTPAPAVPTLAWPVFPGSTAAPPPPPLPLSLQNRVAYYGNPIPPPPATSTAAASGIAPGASAALDATAKIAVTPGLRHEIVSRVQFKFNDLGLGPLDVDGIYGPKTEAAARKFHEILGTPFSGTIHADTVSAILNIPKGTALKPEALLPFMLSPSELAARTQPGSASTAIVQGSTASSTAPSASFDLTAWVKGNWQWFLVGAIGLVTLGLILTGPKDALAGVKEVESLDLDDLDLGDPLPPPRKRKARKSKRKARR